MLRVLALEARWAWLLRTRRLRQILAMVERRGRASDDSGPEPEPRLRRIVSAWAWAGLYLPAADRCLVRALAMHEACTRRGIRTKLVFGVRMNPFRAHCWLQLGEAVLIGDFEQARLFTPIASFG